MTASWEPSLPGLTSPKKAGPKSPKGNLRKGYRWKHEVQKYLEAAGVEVNSREFGAKGDDLYNDTLSIECKDQRTYDLASFMQQAQENRKHRTPVIVIKRKGRPHPRDGYVVLTLEDFTYLITHRDKE